MSEYKEKDQKSGMVTGLTGVAQRKKRGRARGFAFEDNRPETAQLRGAFPLNPSNEAGRPVLQAKGFNEEKQLKSPEPVQKQENKTGLPDDLKAGVENLSGLAMDDVRVSYNSEKPAQLNAHAYTQGTEIHVAPGQEKHLPHEAWHVVQQKEGRVRPTVQMKAGVAVNDDVGLEREADVMGASALRYNEPHHEVAVAYGERRVPRRHTTQLKKMKYNRDSLRFATQAEGRLPSLYFESGEKIRRLRQQHKGGPLIDRKSHGTKHYFFSTEREYMEFYMAAKEGRRIDNSSAKTDPFTGAWHIEYNPTTKTPPHRSGGRVIELEDLKTYYTDEDLRHMAKGIKDWEKGKIRENKMDKKGLRMRQRGGEFEEEKAHWGSKGIDEGSEAAPGARLLLRSYLRGRLTGRDVGAANSYRALLQARATGVWDIKMRHLYQLVTDGVEDYMKMSKRSANMRKYFKKTRQMILGELKIDIFSKEWDPALFTI
nr:DUF4157 domain-containing protein [Candidatus Electrothrix aestuarii]